MLVSRLLPKSFGIYARSVPLKRSSLTIAICSASYNFSSFTYPSRLSVDYNSGGANVWVLAAQNLQKYNAVNHGQGFPNWESPKFIKEALKTATDSNFNQYALPTGHPLLIDILSDIYSSRFNRKINGSNIQTTIGACGAIENACQALLESGDEVLTFDPYFDFYKAQVHHAQGILKTIPLQLKMNAETLNYEWSVDISSLDKAIEASNGKTKIIILNTPHNPTGYVFGREKMEEIAEVVRKYPNLYIISDEVYEDIIFDGREHISIATLDGMFERTLTVSSAAKKFSVTGWKIGWVVGPPDLVQAVHFVARTQNWCQATPLQVAVSEALKITEADDEYYLWLKEMYAQKREQIMHLLKELGLQAITPQGSFFAVADAGKMIEVLVQKGYLNSELFDERKSETWMDWQLANVIAEHAHIVCLPMSAFLSETFPDRYRYLRFSFCVTDEAFERGVQNVKQFKKIMD